MYVRVYVHVIVSDEITFGRAHSVFKVRNSAIECIYWCRSGIQSEAEGEYMTIHVLVCDFRV